MTSMNIFLSCRRGRCHNKVINSCIDHLKTEILSYEYANNNAMLHAHSYFVADFCSRNVELELGGNLKCTTAKRSGIAKNRI